MIRPEQCGRWAAGFGLVLFMATPLHAGVVFELEVTDHMQSPPQSETIQTAVEGRNLKMGVASKGQSSPSEMIFRGESREMVAIDHDDKSYFVMDEAGMRQIAGQINDAMSQMQEMLKDVPAEQRAMVEQMMQQRMPAQQPVARPRSEVRKTGTRADKNGYPCVKYEVWNAGRKTSELWVTDWNNIEGGEDVVGAFEDMAAFFQEMMDAMPRMGQEESGFDDNMFEFMNELGGFPIVTRDFGGDGSLQGESVLRSSRSQVLDPSAFEPPSGYKRQQMF